MFARSIPVTPLSLYPAGSCVRIHVTGGAGFIGANFVLDWLAHNDELVVNLESLAGVRGNERHVFVRGDTSLEKRVECDLYYIEHWSIWLDLKIMWLTIWQGFVHRNAY
jgi:hypothetical protein